MFGLSQLQERLVSLGVLALVVLGLIGYGEHRVRAANKIAVAKREQAIKDQKALDTQHEKEVTDDLKRSLTDLLGAPGPAPVVRLCNSPGSVPAPRTVTIGTPTSPAISSDLQQLPERATPGPNIGPSLRDLALACGIAEVYREHTVEWAIKQAETGAKLVN